jgi:transcriptional regulator with XRE-family HTH domain
MSHCNELLRSGTAAYVYIPRRIMSIQGTDRPDADETADFTAEQIAAAAGMSVRTAQWYKRTGRLPHAARIRLTPPPPPPRMMPAAPRNDDAELLYGKSAEQLASVLGVSLATAQRWKRNRKLPRMARRAIRALMEGDLGIIDPAWRGWSVRNGLLCGPDTYTFRPGEVLAIPFVREQLKNYSAKATAAKNALTWKTQADFIENKYVGPGETIVNPEQTQRELDEAQHYSVS